MDISNGLGNSTRIHYCPVINISTGIAKSNLSFIYTYKTIHIKTNNNKNYNTGMCEIGQACLSSDHRTGTAKSNFFGE